jgi:hypothetical protein
MRYEEKKFGQLEIGEHFWSWELDCGDKELERVKSAPGRAKWADGEIENIYFYPTKKEVWVPIYDGWPKYLIVVCITIITILTIAFGWWIINHFKGI